MDVEFIGGREWSGICVEGGADGGELLGGEVVVGGAGWFFGEAAVEGVESFESDFRGGRGVSGIVAGDAVEGLEGGFSFVDEIGGGGGCF